MELFRKLLNEIIEAPENKQTLHRVIEKYKFHNEELLEHELRAIMALWLSNQLSSAFSKKIYHLLRSTGKEIPVNNEDVKLQYDKLTLNLKAIMDYTLMNDRQVLEVKIMDFYISAQAYLLGVMRDWLNRYRKGVEQREQSTQE